MEDLIKWADVVMQFTHTEQKSQGSEMLGAYFFSLVYKKPEHM